MLHFGNVCNCFEIRNWSQCSPQTSFRAVNWFQSLNVWLIPYSLSPWIMKTVPLGLAIPCGWARSVEQRSQFWQKGLTATTLSIRYNDVRNSASPVEYLYRSVYRVFQRHPFCVICGLVYRVFRSRFIFMFCWPTSLYNLLNKANLVHNLFLVYLLRSVGLIMWEMKKYCLESRSRRISYMKYINGRRTFCVETALYNGLLKERRVEVTGRQGRRRRTLLDNFKERREYFRLKEEALDRSMWRARFGRGFGPVVRQTTKWMSTFISLYKFRATMCPSSGETIVFMRHLVLVTLCHINTVVSPDDGHIVARNM